MTLLVSFIQHAKGFLQTTRKVQKHPALSGSVWQEFRQPKPSGIPQLIACKNTFSRFSLTPLTRSPAILVSMGTSSEVSGEIEGDIEKLIAAKGDQIRQLKAEGISKEDLGPHVEELLALKALAKPADESRVKDSKKASGNPNSEKLKGRTGGAEQASDSEIRQARLDKAIAMVEAGQNPYAYSFDPTHTAAELKIIYDGKLDGGEEDENADVSVAGRIMTRRVFGKLAFFTLLDESGTIQLQLDKKRLGPSFKVCIYVCTVIALVAFN